ncbi:MAG: helix-turn-helix transcriptional regulator [Synergistaceae bacterium]|nr:helix-turn-helix transcriptional regulator [Synergistaceae bacterium]
MGIGKRIRELRKKSGMTQPQLAERVGVHETTIRRWEQETDKGPDTAMIIKLAESLNVSAESLLSESSELIKASNEETPPERSLVYEWGGKNRVVFPNTPETRSLIERLALASMGSKVATA